MQQRVNKDIPSPFIAKSLIIQEHTARLQARIEDIKTNPASFFYSAWSGSKMSQGAHSEIEAHQWLIDLITLCQQGTCYNYLYGTCAIQNPPDVQWFVDVANTYLKQANAGLNCMLKNEVPLLRACVEHLTPYLARPPLAIH